MPTTLPERLPNRFQNGVLDAPRSSAALTIWAIALLALTLPTTPAHTASPLVSAWVLP